MAAKGYLGLGSRSKSAAVILPANDQPTINALVPKRRGIGLFTDDEDDEDVLDAPDAPQQELVMFSGDTSGFAGIQDSAAARQDGRSNVGSAVKNSSRTSKLATPSRPRKSVAGRRGTPYHTTTSRALLRARRESKGEDEEEILISQSMFGSAPTENGGSKKTGSTAAAYSWGEEGETTDEDSPVEEEQILRREIFSRKPKSPRQPSASTTTQPQQEPTGPRRTWGDWLRSILPAVVAGPVTAIKREMSPASPVQGDIFVQTPHQEIASFDIPGSFEKSSPPRERDTYINPNFLNHKVAYDETPVKSSPDGLFEYPTSRLFSGSPVQDSPQPPVSVKKGSRGPAAPSGVKRIIPAAPEAFRKPSNFIQRMRDAKKTKRYDPYSRPSVTTFRGVTATRLAAEGGKLTAEEELELHERREKDRRVQEAEDRYIRLAALRKLGRPVEDEEMEDKGPTPNNNEKAVTIEEVQDEESNNNGMAATTGEVQDENMDADKSGSTTPPISPPQKSSEPLFQNLSESASQPLFQDLSTTAPADKKDDVTPPSWSFSTVSSFNSNAGSFKSDISSFTEPDSDKENVQSPPPPPTMSHRELPSNAPIAAPPPVMESTNLFSEKQPIGGFGIGGGHSVDSMPPPAAPSARQRFDKFKPRVSSSLRESSTIDKENDNDKENPTASNTEGSSSAKSSKAAFGTQVVYKPSTGAGTGALREVESNAPVQSAIKVDLRAKVAAVSTKYLPVLLAIMLMIVQCSYPLGISLP
jgi:hypothetical protein